jgi:predicted butyrate kinase (DUF1464 family)
MIRDPLFRVINDRLYQGVDPDQFELFAVEVVRQDFPSAVPVKGGGGVGVKGGTRTPTGRSSQDPMSGVKPINHNSLQHRTTLNNKNLMDLRASQIALDCGVLLPKIDVC